MKPIIQHYEKSTFTDSRQFHHSAKCKPEHITVITGDADPADIAADINRAMTSKVVGWAK